MNVQSHCPKAFSGAPSPSSLPFLPALGQAPAKKPNIIVIMGDDIGWSNIGAYNQRHHGRPDAEPRQARRRGHALHRLLRRGELHRGPRELHHRRAADPHRHDDRRPGGLADRHPRRGPDDRDGAEVDGLRHRPVRQEPPRRPERVPADRPRLRRVLRLPVSPGRDGRPATPTTRRPARTRSARGTWSTPGQRTSTIRPSCRAGARSASRRSRTPARSIPSGWRRSTTRSSTSRSTSWTRRKKDSKPFFLWLNPTRMHVVTHLSQKYEALRNSENGWSIQEAGMAQLDDVVGSVMKKLKDMGLDDDTIVVFTTDNGAENFTWPDGGQTPFAGGKGTALEGGFRVPAISAGPARCRPARSRTASSPASTGSRPSSRRPAIRTSPRS